MKPIKHFFKQKFVEQFVAILVFFIGASWVPQAWQSRLAPQWFAGDLHLQTALSKGVEQWMNQSLSRENFSTGSQQFNGEWLFGTYLMAAMGWSQMGMEHPEQKEHYARLMEQAIDQLLSPSVRKFDSESWGSDPLETLNTQEGHAAYLGYINLTLGLHRKLNPHSKFTPLNDEISDALRRRIEASPTLLIETYPYETYPVDNCAVITSVALNGKIRNLAEDLPLRWVKRCRNEWIDPRSGLLFQAIDKDTGRPTDAPRGSGTTLGLYFLSFMDPILSRDLYTAVTRELSGHVLGFGLMREYPHDIRGRHGDIDSGPIIFGYGISPTGFSIAGARIHNDPATFRALYATASAAGAPLQSKGQLHFVTGGPLGDAILFAMLTAQPAMEEQP